jgi:hypothetical protein
MTKPALVTGGCQVRIRHSISPSKWLCSWVASAVRTSIGWVLQRTGAGIVWV